MSDQYQDQDLPPVTDDSDDNLTPLDADPDDYEADMLALLDDLIGRVSEAAGRGDIVLEQPQTIYELESKVRRVMQEAIDYVEKGEEIDYHELVLALFSVVGLTLSHLALVRDGQERAKDKKRLPDRK